MWGLPAARRYRSPLSGDMNRGRCAVLDVQHGRVPRGVVNKQVLDSPKFKARLEDYRGRFGS